VFENLPQEFPYPPVIVLVSQRTHFQYHASFTSILNKVEDRI
jgi:hypothetical protein